jgi:negative regulator of flagellin synthesis FlgM
MKIDSSIPSPTTPPKVRQQTVTTTAAKSSAASNASVATSLQQAGTLGAMSAPFDGQRVAEIRQAIADGHFQIDAGNIAGRLIDDVRALLAKDRATA